MATRDFIGTRGEYICSMLLMRFCRGERPFFKTTFLGEKFQTLDFFVELVDAGRSSPYFFVQVKSTRSGYTKERKHLKVSVSQEDMERLLGYPAPTYIVGIDETREVGYIISANEGSPRRISGLATDYELNCENLERLWNEVSNFWNDRDMSMRDSVFKGGRKSGS